MISTNEKATWNENTRASACLTKGHAPVCGNKLLVWTARALLRQAQGRARRARVSLGRDLQRRRLLAKADRRHEEDILRIHRV
jgi:hypothetical protein